MTEAEWLAATDPMPMLHFLRGNASDRKYLLFVLASYRLLDVLLDMPPENSPRFDVIERYADGYTTLEDVRIHWLPLLYAHEAWWIGEPSAWGLGFAHRCNHEVLYPPVEELPPFLTDIFGNPFRPVSLDPSWRTSTTLALAEGIYAERAFDRLPILADALQDAGCDNDDILSHCRSDGPHVRGCWPVDLILGKS